MSTSPKTSFCQINFRATIASVGFNAWGVGSVPRNATSRMEKDGELQKMIRSTRFVYAQQLKMAWDIKNWDQKFSKTSRTKQLLDVLAFHEFRMIHGR
jgi:hypothetical protein